MEEYLGRETRAYYDVLGSVGGGRWNPHHDTRPWIRFMLKAHFVQASLLVWRMKLLGRLWTEIETLLHELTLPERLINPLVDAATGYKVRNALYRKTAEISENLASRDLKVLVDHKLLTPLGENRGRYYAPSTRLNELRNSCYEPFTAIDPFSPQSETAYLSDIEP